MATYPLPYVIGKKFLAAFELQPEFVFKGAILDEVGKPVPNAKIELGDCDYLKKHDIVADEDGYFDVYSGCSSFTIKKIYNPASSQFCLSKWQPRTDLKNDVYKDV